MAKHGEQRIYAAIRETYEETGCWVGVIKQVYQSDSANYYLCRKTGGHAKINDHETLEVKWFSLEEVKELFRKKLLKGCKASWFEEEN